MKGRTAPRMVTARLRAGFLIASLVIAGCATPSTVTWYASPPPNFDPVSPILRARDIAFDRTVVTVPYGRESILVFENLDPAPHNVSIYRETGTGTQGEPVYKGDVFDGPATRWLVIPALAPGQYVFVCDVYPIPSMTGSLVAG